MKKVLIIGAGFLQDFVIQKAKNLGYYTLAVDANPKAPGFAHADQYAVINIVDEEACLQYARQEKIDGVLTAATDYGVLTAAYIAQEMGLPGLNYEVAKTVKNKYRIRKCLYENHVDDTQQGYEVDADSDLDTLKNCLLYPVMVKPCDGSGSRGTNRVDAPKMLADACRLAMAASLSHKAVIEKFIIGSEYGAETLVVNGEVHVLGIMKKWMTNPPYYAELGHAIPSDLPTETERHVRQCVEQAIRALGINSGSVNMDMLITPDGKVYIVDIGARMGGNLIGSHVIPYGTGVDYLANMIRAAVGDGIDMRQAGQSAVATKLLAFSDGVVRRLPDFAEFQKKYNVEIFHHLQLGQKVKEYHTNLDGCGYIVARAITPQEAAKKAEKALAEITEYIFN